MSKTLAHKLQNRSQRKARVRAVVSGTAQRPRLSLYVSNANVTAQLIDDTAGKTLAYVTTVGQKSLKGNMTEKAIWVGNEIAGKAKAAKVKTVALPQVRERGVSCPKWRRLPRSCFSKWSASCSRRQARMPAQSLERSQSNRGTRCCRCRNGRFRLGDSLRKSSH